MVFDRFYEHSLILTIFHIFVSEATNYLIKDTNKDESAIDWHYAFVTTHNALHQEAYRGECVHLHKRD